MHKIQVINSATRKSIEISDNEFNNLKLSNQQIKATSSFLHHYSVFIKNLNSLERDVFYHAIDFKQYNNDQYMVSNEVFARADHTVISHLATFMKLPELLPSHLSRMLRSTHEKKLAIEKKSALYDDPTSNYAFLCELRNSIVHSNVDLTINTGISNFDGSEIGLFSFGYFINFDKFLKKSARSGKVKILSPMRDALCDDKGRIDLMRSFSLCARAIYKELLEPKVSELVSAIDNSIDSIDRVLISNNLQSIKVPNFEQTKDYIVIAQDDLTISKLVIDRTKSLFSELRIPQPANFISIAPSYQASSKSFN
ncbi:MAG: hypothetical protein KKE30_06175 [Gammaproteobacteria bacterium]|nr:hypothetical protein [Gammaproteobacteria bacterium]MBU1555672.1 hypothetical protein [Gammaproteobacteria bacterium]MBU2070556.1 hypothetical protein [Gammaproteobacteria bacterium]MBU2185368.1 hypothetical protein [Gammaproteobacteria bacterium]MBU2207062.1 hypothetical protein [Gammaproteobacteria bacterium]